MAEQTDTSGRVAEKQRGDTRFKKGQPKPPSSGRKKGTPNKNSIAAAEIMDRRGMNPIERLCDIADDPQSHPDRVLKALCELASYAHPKKREHTVDLAPKTASIIAALEAGRQFARKFIETSTGAQEQPTK